MGCRYGCASRGNCNEWLHCRVVANNEESYRYLVESIRRFPKQEDFARMMHEAGFALVKYEILTGGIVAIHSGFKT